MQSSESEKDAKKKLKALKIIVDMFVFIILEFIEATYKHSLSNKAPFEILSSGALS